MSEREPHKLSKRTCRYCGRKYRAPVGEKWAGCLDCAPRLTVSLTRAEPKTD